MEENRKARHAPAPWALAGSGYILLYRFTPEFVREKCFLSEALKGVFQGGFGSVMYVDYLSSDVGPYKELLFIPGVFDFSGRAYYSITRIYVSTRESVSGGRMNWGIPKEHASFETTRQTGGLERVLVSADSGVVAEFLFKSLPFSVLFTIAVIPPFLRTLAHPTGGRILLTTPNARGTIAPARTLKVRVDESLFPPVGQERHLATVRVPHFFMVFPQAEVMECRW